MKNIAYAAILKISYICNRILLINKKILNKFKFLQKIKQEEAVFNKNYNLFRVQKSIFKNAMDLDIIKHFYAE